MCRALHVQQRTHREHNPLAAMLQGVYSAAGDDPLTTHLGRMVLPAAASVQGLGGAEGGEMTAPCSLVRALHSETGIAPQTLHAHEAFDDVGGAADSPGAEDGSASTPPPPVPEGGGRVAAWTNVCTAMAAWQPQKLTDETRNTLRSQLEHLVAGGIPASLRRHVWFELSGAAARQAAYPEGHYHRLTCHAVPSDDVLRLIEKDVMRTFPGHSRLQRPAELRKLERVLCALACNNSRIGYTQGMNRLAAFSLLVLSEEEAFWVTDTLVNEILPPLLLSDSLQDAHAASHTLECLLGNGALSRHLHSMDLPLSMMFTEWFMCLGTSLWPSELVFRVWDAVFLHGFGVMFDVCVHMLRCAAPRIAQLAGRPRQLYELLVSLPREWRDPRDILGALGSKRSVAAAGVAFMSVARKEVARMGAEADAEQ